MPEDTLDAFTEIKLGGPGLLCFARTAGRVEQGLVHDWLSAARKGGLVATAVGVETRESLAAAKVLGFDCAQGFAIAAPMPAQDLDRFLDSWTVPAAPLSVPSAPQRVNAVHEQQAALEAAVKQFAAAMAADSKPLDIPEKPEDASTWPAARKRGRGWRLFGLRKAG
jgi:hypothetical protein